MAVNVGCELAVFAAGLIPGRGFERRARRLRWMRSLLPVFNWRLDRLLRCAADTARGCFDGEITYGAGSVATAFAAAATVLVSESILAGRGRSVSSRSMASSLVLPHMTGSLAGVNGDGAG